MRKLLVSFSLLLLFVFILALSSLAQQPKKRPTPKPTVPQQKSTPGATTNENSKEKKRLTNADVIRMVKAGFGEAIILNAIQDNESQFDVSIDGLFELKNAGVSQKVIETMQSVAAGKQETPAVSEQPATPTKKPSPDDPLSKQSKTNTTSELNMGVIVLIDGTKRVEMKQASYGARGGGLGSMIPYVGKSKFRSTLQGNRAQLRVTDTTPEFELMLPSNINTTNVTVLVKADQKSDRREIELARASMIGGSTAGFRKEVSIPTTFEEIKTQALAGGIKYTLYRVKVVNPLPPGEYIFTPQYYTYYDFGIDPKAQNINPASQQAPEKATVSTTNTPAIKSAPTNTNSDRDNQSLPTYGNIAEIKGFNRIYVFAEDAESRDRIIKAFKDAPQFQIVGNPQEAQIILEYKVLSRDSNMDRGDKDIRVKSQLSAIYLNAGKRIVAWSDTAEYARLTSGGIGLRTQHNENKLTQRFIKAMKN